MRRMLNKRDYVCSVCFDNITIIFLSVGMWLGAPTKPVQQTKPNQTKPKPV